MGGGGVGNGVGRRRSPGCGKDRKMAALGSPSGTLRGLLRELRYLSAATGRPYRDTAAYRYLVKSFRAHRVTSEKLCRAQHELHFQASTYLCLLRSIREHVALHQEFHGMGERSVEESAGLVGLKLPSQPGGKGWEP
ncbi:protein FMC1 homolog [Dasypus novemcinctus]|uniref:protein FMC1 homolog n=1 Tax=Dasypus novemcinctus TaxID=9361 RepID=UPI000C8457B6|nr:protein FMC1 homolog [Dasypus novemcinctus]